MTQKYETPNFDKWKRGAAAGRKMQMTLEDAVEADIEHNVKKTTFQDLVEKVGELPYTVLAGSGPMEKEGNMKDLIEVLNIFAKYDPPEYFTHCEHDVLYVFVEKYQEVTKEDKERLEVLGFCFNEEEKLYYSCRFGSA